MKFPNQIYQHGSKKKRQPFSLHRTCFVYRKVGKVLSYHTEYERKEHDKRLSSSISNPPFPTHFRPWCLVYYSYVRLLPRIQIFLSFYSCFLRFYISQKNDIFEDFRLNDNGVVSLCKMICRHNQEVQHCHSKQWTEKR